MEASSASERSYQDTSVAEGAEDTERRQLPETDPTTAAPSADQYLHTWTMGKWGSGRT